MLEGTFLHVPGIGHKSEVALWQMDFRSWADYLSPDRAIPYPFALPYVEESLKRRELGDAWWFGDRLPARDVWRLLPDFLDRACFLDIETTGTGYDDDVITVVGTYDMTEYRAFVKGHNLSELPAALSQYRLLVTYNGKGFDARFIERHFGRVLRHMAHLDLRFPLRRIGYKGGLKAIENATALPRGHQVKGLDGYDAVLLWRQYERGRTGALETLIRYNAEDVVGLPALAVMSYNELAAELELGWPQLPPIPRPALHLPYDPFVVDALHERHEAHARVAETQAAG